MTNNNWKARFKPWNEDIFRGDADVQYLTPIQRWMYRTLLQAAWVCANRPHLPDDDKQLWKLSGSESLQQWLDNSGPVRELFTPVEISGVPLLSRKRLVDDWTTLQNVRTAQAEGGRKGTKSRWNSSLPPTPPNPTETVTGTGTGTVRSHRDLPTTQSQLTVPYSLPIKSTETNDLQKEHVRKFEKASPEDFLKHLETLFHRTVGRSGIIEKRFRPGALKTMQNWFRKETEEIVEKAFQDWLEHSLEYLKSQKKYGVGLFMKQGSDYLEKIHRDIENAKLPAIKEESPEASGTGIGSEYDPTN